MASEWSESTVGAICDAGLAELQTGPFGSQLHAHDYVAAGTPVVPTEAIRDRRIDHSVLPRISNSKAQELARHRLRTGDILFARRGAQATGHIGYVREKEEGFICGTGAIRLRINHELSTLDPAFLSHLFANPASVAWFKSHAIGATMPNLNEGIIRSFPLSVPPLTEQRAIAHILGTLDDKIDLTRRMNETLEAIARALFKSWFVDFDPVRAKAEGRQPVGIDPATAAHFPSSLETSPHGDIPREWRLGTVGDDFSITMGQSPPGETYNEAGEGLPFFQGRADFHFRYPSNRVFCTAPTRFAEPGDTLVSVRAPVGDVNMAAEKCCIGRGVAAVRHKSGSRSYTYYAMRSLNEAFGRFEAEGTVFGSINKEDFHKLPIVVPPDSILSRFEALLFPLDEAIQVNEHQSHILETIRDALLPRLLSGDLRVKDAAKFVGTTA